MGKGGQHPAAASGIIAEQHKDFSAEEVSTHSSYKETRDSWLVYDGRVYNISNFAAKHPGGWQLITTYEGQDATDVMEAFHPDRKILSKYLKPLEIGTCEELKSAASTDPVMKDFNELTAKLEKEGYFEPNLWFFAAVYAHIVAIEIFAWYLVAYHNVLDWPYYLGSILIALIQGVGVQQASWLQHDAGHKGIFGKNNRLNFWAQQMTMGFLVGGSTKWWKDRHSRHHAKTNIYKKDPDIKGEGIVLFGDVQFQDPTEFIFKPLIPYQAFTFIFAAVPSIATVLFIRPILLHMVVNASLYDMIFMSTFYIKNFLAFYPYIGLRGCAQMYFGMRLVQSVLFTWITQISHIPRDIIQDCAPSKSFNWVRMQCEGTLNVKGSLFNDWFTGHLNYQIEHHLWPRIPRHHYPAVAPMAKALCEKHGIDYTVIPNLWGGCVDVVSKIQETAEHFTEHHYGPTKKTEDAVKKNE